MKTMVGDLLEIDRGLVCHQVNCKMVMGAGLALAIRNKYPVAYEEYEKLGRKVPPGQRLGLCQVVKVLPDLYVANLFGQFSYGRNGTKTDYGALSSAVERLSEWRAKYRPDLRIYAPCGIGCGLAGGDWKIVERILETFLPNDAIVRKGNG